MKRYARCPRGRLSTARAFTSKYLKAYDYVKEFGEGVDRMCRELSAIGTKEPQYHLVAFIMKATVWANVLDEGQENTSDQKRPENDQKENITTQKLPRNYPETKH